MAKIETNTKDINNLMNEVVRKEEFLQLDSEFKNFKSIDQAE